MRAAKWRRELVNKTWNQTPAGSGADEDYRPDRHIGYPPDDRASAHHRVPELEPFVEGCLSLLGEVPRDGETRTGFFLFLLGAADGFWDRFGLEDARFPAYAEDLLQRFELDPGQAATLVTAIPQLPRQGPARDALLEGARTLDLWLDSGGSNPLLRVKELIPVWRRTLAR
jgi:hypothetical protein